MMSTKHDKIVNTHNMYIVLNILCAVSFRYMYLILQDTGRHQCYIMEFRLDSSWQEIDVRPFLLCYMYLILGTEVFGDIHGKTCPLFEQMK